MSSNDPLPNHPSSMEPLLPSKGLEPLKEMAAELARKASILEGRLHPYVKDSLKDLLRAMNSYYTNLIEGQGTHPLAIDAALKKKFETNQKEKNLQLLAVAHIEVQKKAEEKLKQINKSDLFDIHFLSWLHKEFYSQLPEEFRKVQNEEKSKSLILTPGEVRKSDVVVGKHLPPSFKSLSIFLKRFHRFYSTTPMDPLLRIVATVAAHHRLAWIHPFLDGNGRVTRLFTDCCFYKDDIGGFGLWTISRGLARHRTKYYEFLDRADHSREGTYDGRGALSDQALVEFCTYFLETAIDQVDFMSDMLQLDHIERRLESFISIMFDFKALKKEDFYLLRDLFLRGEIPRGEASRILNMPERTARNEVTRLVKMDIIGSKTEKSDLRLKFNPIFASHLFPNLYPSNLNFELRDLIKK